MAFDPYVTLGVSPGVSDVELRTAYRKLVQKHHPDHNGGSTDSARRFEAIQLAYAQIREQRASGQPAAAPAAGSRPTGRTPPPPRGPSNPDLDERLAAIEFELREAQRAREAELREARLARERAAEAVRAAARDADPRPADAKRDPRRATDEELGYITTDDSLGKILSDARGELADRFAEARTHPVVQRVSDLIDGLDDLISNTDRHRRRDPRDGD
jgi:hypothetical protein